MAKLPRESGGPRRRGRARAIQWLLQSRAIGWCGRMGTLVAIGGECGGSKTCWRWRRPRLLVLRSGAPKLWISGRKIIGHVAVSRIDPKEEGFVSDFHF